MFALSQLDPWVRRGAAALGRAERQIRSEWSAAAPLVRRWIGRAEEEVRPLVNLGIAVSWLLATLTLELVTGAVRGAAEVARPAGALAVASGRSTGSFAVGVAQVAARLIERGALVAAERAAAGATVVRHRCRRRAARRPRRRRALEASQGPW